MDLPTMTAQRHTDILWTISMHSLRVLPKEELFVLFISLFLIQNSFS